MSDDILAISEQLEALQKRLNAVGRKYLITHDHLEDIISEVRKMEAMAEATERIDFDALLMAANELPQTAQPRAAHIRRLVLELSGARADLDVRVQHCDSERRHIMSHWGHPHIEYPASYSIDASIIDDFEKVYAEYKQRMAQMPSDTKPDLHCVIEELYDLEVLPFGWVLLRRADKNNPDYIGIKYLSGIDPLQRIAALETKLKDAEAENVRLSRERWDDFSKDDPQSWPRYVHEWLREQLAASERQAAEKERVLDMIDEISKQLELKIYNLERNILLVIEAKDEAYGRARKLRAELEDARNWARWAYRKGRQLEAEVEGYKNSGNMTHLGVTLKVNQLEAELDTERSLRHEAQSGYGNLMEKTEALEAEVGGLAHVKQSYEEDYARYAEEITNLCGRLDALEAQVVEQAQTIQDGHERQARLATKLHDTETNTLRLWRACLEYLKAPPTNLPARKKFAKFVTGGKSDA